MKTRWNCKNNEMVKWQDSEHQPDQYTSRDNHACNHLSDTDAFRHAAGSHRKTKKRNEFAKIKEEKGQIDPTKEMTEKPTHKR
jgi:hypothetical protein